MGMCVDGGKHSTLGRTTIEDLEHKLDGRSLTMAGNVYLRCGRCDKRLIKVQVRAEPVDVSTLDWPPLPLGLDPDSVEYSIASEGPVIKELASNQVGVESVVTISRSLFSGMADEAEARIQLPSQAVDI